MTWNQFVNWAAGNGWFQFANGWPKDASTVVISSDVARPNLIPVEFFWVGWDNNGDGFTRQVRIFKSLRQASRFARIMSQKMQANFKSML